MQAVDGLKTSAYLLDTAKEHIEGKISIDEVQKRIQSYYEQRTDRIEIEKDTKETGTRDNPGTGEELRKMEQVQKARSEIEKQNEKPANIIQFKVV